MGCQKMCDTDHVYCFVQEVFKLVQAHIINESKGPFAHHCSFLRSSVVFAAHQ